MAGANLRADVDGRVRVTPSELTALIQDLLEIDDLAVDDNFFDVGGNSILALAVLAAVQETCGIRIPLIDMIHAPTVAGMSELIARATA